MGHSDLTETSNIIGGKWRDQLLTQRVEQKEFNDLPLHKRIKMSVINGGITPSFI
jgi:hypothetical protein